jgi:hypothetical protein
VHCSCKDQSYVLLDELRKARAVLTDEGQSKPPTIKGRPVLRLIEGELSSA